MPRWYSLTAPKAQNTSRPVTRGKENASGDYRQEPAEWASWRTAPVPHVVEAGKSGKISSSSEAAADRVRQKRRLHNRPLEFVQQHLQKRQLHFQAVLASVRRVPDFDQRRCRQASDRILVDGDFAKRRQEVVRRTGRQAAEGRSMCGPVARQRVSCLQTPYRS